MCYCQLSAAASWKLGHELMPSQLLDEHSPNHKGDADIPATGTISCLQPVVSLTCQNAHYLLVTFVERHVGSRTE